MLLLNTRCIALLLVLSVPYMSGCDRCRLPLLLNELLRLRASQELPALPHPACMIYPGAAAAAAAADACIP
jgi:hypothetical protein